MKERMVMVGIAAGIIAYIVGYGAIFGSDLGIAGGLISNERKQFLLAALAPLGYVLLGIVLLLAIRPPDSPFPWTFFWIATLWTLAMLFAR